MIARRAVLAVTKLLPLAAALVPLAAAAVDMPHTGVFGDDCQACHTLHNAPGASLTSRSGNANLCFSCHNLAGNYFGQWNETDAQAVPGTSGHSHSWSGPATGEGATVPGPTTPIGRRLTGGTLQCSACHDEHNYRASSGGRIHASAPTPIVGGAAGSVTLRTPPSTAIARGYYLDVVTRGDAGTATFRVSHDGITWLGWDGTSSWVIAGPNGKPTGTGVTLDDPAGVTVDFSGTFEVGDRYRFYVGKRFLRVPNDDAAMCTTCHQNMNQSWDNVEGRGGTLAGNGQPIVMGETYFSHPVGTTMNQNARGYDRSAATILDAHGEPQQGSPDGNPTNDLVLSGTGRVTCLTCHAPHSADSNSLSPDAR